jgi:hypothetical protein
MSFVAIVKSALSSAKVTEQVRITITSKLVEFEESSVGETLAAISKLVHEAKEASAAVPFGTEWTTAEKQLKTQTEVLVAALVAHPDNADKRQERALIRLVEDTLRLHEDFEVVISVRASVPMGVNF